jgi:hypothetical protein
VQPRDIPAFASLLSDKAAALRDTKKGPFQTFFFNFYFRKSGVWMEDMFVGAPSLFLAGAQELLYIDDG